jgi:hypothetical protein
LRTNTAGWYRYDWLSWISIVNDHIGSGNYSINTSGISLWTTQTKTLNTEIDLSLADVQRCLFTLDNDTLIVLD